MTGNGNGVTRGQLILALIGQLVLFIGYVAVDRLAVERRLTQFEERLTALYAQIPKVRAAEEAQDKRLTDLEHDMLRRK